MKNKSINTVNGISLYNVENQINDILTKHEYNFISPRDCWDQLTKLGTKGRYMLAVTEYPFYYLFRPETIIVEYFDGPLPVIFMTCGEENPITKLDVPEEKMENVAMKPDGTFLDIKNFSADYDTGEYLLPPGFKDVWRILSGSVLISPRDPSFMISDDAFRIINSETNNAEEIIKCLAAIKSRGNY